MCVLNPARTDERVMREATALVEAGYVVTIVDVEHDHALPHDEMSRGARLKHALLPARWKRFYSPTGGPSWMAFKVLRVLYALWLTLLVSADVYHAHDITALPACYLAAVLRRKRLVFDAHELPLVQPHIVERRVTHTLAVWLLRMLLCRCDAAITVSPPLVDVMRDLYGGPRAWVIRNVPLYQTPERTDRLREFLGLPVGTRIALYQGGIQANRTLDILVRAAHYLDPGVVIVLMGNGPLTGALAEMIAEENVGERVKMLPAVPYRELLTWTASADLGLLAVKPDFSLSVKYSLPNKLFEYLMAGLPVLTSEMVAIEETVLNYHAGAVVRDLDPQVVAKAINTLLADKQEWSRMRGKALEASKNDLCWEAEKIHLVASYASLTSVRPTPRVSPPGETRRSHAARVG
jgi:glycosyltransferase involved in cell wall biosynthesis